MTHVVEELPPVLSAEDLRVPSAATTSPTVRLSLGKTDASPRHRSRVPAFVRFPLAVVMSLGLSAALYSFVPELTGYDLAAVSRSLNEPWQIGALLAWKVSEVLMAWLAGFDYLDVLNLSILANLPYYALLYVFYATSIATVAMSFSVDVLSLAVPFYLLRNLNHHNAPKTTTTPKSINDLAADRHVQLYMSLFAAAVYSLIVYTSFYTWLPVYMVVHFDEVRSLEAAHNAVLPVLFAAFAPIGYAAKSFLFKPSIASARGPLTAGYKPFDPRTATFADTLSYNLGLGPYVSRASVLTRRTTLLVCASFANTLVRVFGTVEGSELFGAAGWAGLWSAAALAVGLGFAWVGQS